AVTHARAAHSHRTDAGHDLTLGQMPVAHQPPPAIIGKLVGMAAEQARNLGLNRLRQKRSRAVAQNLGQRIGKSSWLRELENISLSHGVSLLRWRSGGLEHPHDTPPYPFTPSPTFAHSSTRLGRVLINAQIAAGYALTLRLRHLWYLVTSTSGYGCPKNGTHPLYIPGQILVATAAEDRLRSEAGGGYDMEAEHKSHSGSGRGLHERQRNQGSS